MQTVENLNCTPYKMQIGEYSLYVEYIRVNGSMLVSECSTVSGKSVITNSSAKQTLAVVGGRLANDGEFLKFVVFVENMLKSKSITDISYCGVKFSDCILKTYSAERKERNITDIKITFMAKEVIADECQADT